MTKPQISLIERVARAIFKADFRKLTGYEPSHGQLKFGWENYTLHAEAAINAIQLEGK